MLRMITLREQVQFTLLLFDGSVGIGNLNIREDRWELEEHCFILRIFCCGIDIALNLFEQLLVP